MPYTAQLVEDKSGEYRVWSEESSFSPGARERYVGPVASVSSSDDGMWVHIETDPSEGHVMINAETLPKLIEALVRLQRHLASVCCFDRL